MATCPSGHVCISLLPFTSTINVTLNFSHKESDELKVLH